MRKEPKNTCAIQTVCPPQKTAQKQATIGNPMEFSHSQRISLKTYICETVAGIGDKYLGATLGKLKNKGKTKEKWKQV